MSTGPFGLEVTNLTLSVMSQYDDKEMIDQIDRAREAMGMIHLGDKNLDAVAAAWELKKRYGNGKSCLVLVYNATGGRVTMMDSQDWSGRVYNSQPPHEFQNGQWIAFLHVRDPSGPNEVIGGKIFRGHNIDGRARDFMVCWNIQSALRNTAYTEIRDAGGFAGWNKTTLLRAKGITRAKDNHKCASTITIGGYTTSECVAVLQHQFEPLPDPYAKS